MKINNKQLGQLNEVGKKVLLNSNKNISIFVVGNEGISLISTLWRRFENEFEDPGLTALWAWLESWIESYGHLVKYQFLLGLDRDGHLVGITILVKETLRKIPFSVKSYHIGTYGEPLQDSMQMTNSQILIKKGYEKVFINAIVETVMVNFAAEELVFDHLWIKHANIIKELTFSQKYKVFIDESPMLFMDFEKVRKNNGKLSEHLGKSMAYQVRKTIRDFNDLEVHWPKNTKEALEILDELIAIYTKNMKKINRKGKFASTSYLTFQKKLVEKLFEFNKTLFIRVRSKKYGTLGCFYCLVDHNIAYATQLGIVDLDTVDIGFINKKRVYAGYTVHALFMDECLKRGFKGYSFSTGLDTYKSYLTNAKESEFNIHIMNGIKPWIRFLIFKYISKLDKNKKASLTIRALRLFVNLANKKEKGNEHKL